MVDFRPLTQTYAVSPQIDPSDMEAIRTAGYTTIIDNRPDGEIPPSHGSDAMQAAAEAAGLKFVYIPVNGRDMSMDVVNAHKAAVSAADGPVFAYCASGTRSTIVWALGQVGDFTTDEIVGAAANGGYDVEHLRGTLDALAR